MITAKKNNLTRNFSEQQWSNMPKDKFGWIPVGSESQQIEINGSNTVPDEIIQKK